MKQCFVFPSILRELNYEDRLGPGDRRSATVTLDEARELCRKYLHVMSSGVRYDEMISATWNGKSPNTLCEKNVEAANLILARLSYKKADAFLAKPIPGLASIPLKADLFESDRYDWDAAGALDHLDGYDGVDAANASKLLHQKRRGLIPIFDSLVRRALGIVWTRGNGASSYVPLLTRYREFLGHGDNASQLDRLIDWMADEGIPTRGVVPTRVRALDILAWSLMWYHDPFK